MKRIFKKISTLTILSTTLIFGSLTGYNSLKVYEFNDSYKFEKMYKAKWLSSVSNEEKLEQKYDNYYYTMEKYKKDEAFFNEIFKKDMTYENYSVDNKKSIVHNSRFEGVDYSFIRYMNIYNKYQGKVDVVLEQKKLNKEWADGHINKETMSKNYNKNIQNLYPNSTIANLSGIRYLTNFEIGEYGNKNTKIFNSLFKKEGLPEFFLSVDQKRQYDNQAYEAYEKKNQALHEKILAERNATLIDFFDKYQKGNLTEQQKYNFFKTIHFINDTINDKYKMMDINNILYNSAIKNNSYYTKMISLIGDNTKYYLNINDSISENKNLSDSEQNNLESPF